MAAWLLENRNIYERLAKGTDKVINLQSSPQRHDNIVASEVDYWRNVSPPSKTLSHFHVLFTQLLKGFRTNCSIDPLPANECIRVLSAEWVSLNSVAPTRIDNIVAVTPLTWYVSLRIMGKYSEVDLACFTIYSYLDKIPSAESTADAPQSFLNDS